MKNTKEEFDNLCEQIVDAVIEDDVNKIKKMYPSFLLALQKANQEGREDGLSAYVQATCCIANPLAGVGRNHKLLREMLEGCFAVCDDKQKSYVVNETLRAVCAAGDIEIAKELIEKFGGDLTYTSYGEGDALDYAIEQGEREMILFIVPILGLKEQNLFSSKNNPSTEYEGVQNAKR
jgi:hypothetical protein